MSYKNHNPDTDDYKYWAFVSYSSKDRTKAKWLHRAIEQYKLPKTLRKYDTGLGVTKKRLTPLFLDRDELPTNARLAKKLEDALTRSRFMIVMCSPDAAASEWVNKEIERFASLGRADRIITVITKGDPSDVGGPEDPFPPALRAALAPDEPIAADLHKHGDGKRMTRMKVVAGLLSLDSLDVLIRRDEKARRGRARFAYALTGIFAMISALAIGGGYLAWQRTIQSADRLQIAVEGATGLVERAVKNAQDYNLPVSVVTDFLTQAEEIFDRVLDDVEDPDLLLQHSDTLIRLSRLYQQIGDTANSLQAAEKSIMIIDAILNRTPDDKRALRGKSIALDEKSDVLLAQGESEQALENYRASLAIAQKLSSQDPGNAGWQRDLSVSYNKIADVLLAQGESEQALGNYRASLAIRQKLSSQDPGNAGWQRDLLVSNYKLGQVYLTQGNLERALMFFKRALTIADELIALDPRNARYQNDKNIIANIIARIEQAQKNDAIAQLDRESLITISLETWLDDGADHKTGNILHNRN